MAWKKILYDDLLGTGYLYECTNCGKTTISLDGYPKEKCICERNKIMFTWNEDANSDIWYNDKFNTVKECLEDAKKSGVAPGTEIAIGVCEDYIPHIYADDVLERLGDNASEEVGEVADDWLQWEHGKGYYKADLLEEKLNKVLDEWLKETNQVPNFYKINILKDLFEVK